MASTRKSQLVLTCNAQAIKDVFDYLNKELGRIKLRRDALLRQYEGKMWTADAKREFKQLGDDIAAITSMQQKNEEEMRKYGQVMADLAGSKLRDMKGAVREVTSALNKMTENDPNRRKLIDDLAKLKNEIAVIGGNRRSLNEVTNDLKNLSNVRFDHLTQDLEAVRARYAQLSEAERQSAKGLGLKNAEQLLQAQIGVAQYGRAGSGAIVGTDRDKAMAMDSKARQEAIIQLQQEQQRLRSLYQATDGAKGFEIINKESLDRLHQVNQAVANLTEAERKYVQTQREESVRNEMLAKENEIIDRIKKGQKVTLEELIELQKHYKSELEKSQGLNITDPNDIKEMERLNQNLRITEDHIRKIRAEAGGEVMKNANYAASNLGNVSIDQLAEISKRGKELFSVMKPSDSGYDQLKADLIAIDAELERVTPKWNELAQAEQALAKANDVVNRAWSNSKVTLTELTEAQNTLEAQIKKMEGLSLGPAEETELKKTKAMLEEVNKALDDIAMKDIDFNNLDATPTEKLEAALKNLEQQEKRLAGTQKDEAEEVANKKRAIREQIQRNKQATIDYANAEKVAANRGKHSVEELQVAYKALEQKLLGLRTNEYKEIAKTKQQMQQLKTKIDDVTGAVKKQSSTWDSAVRNITAYVGVFGAFNFIKNKIVDVFKANTQLSDSLANIRKVSGLSSEAINELYNNISKIDSRNTIETLNELAYTGAKLGIGQNYGVEGLTGFVKAAEQVQMALGEDMGEKSLPELSKMVEVMGLIPKYGVEQSMQKAASAIFQLGATSTATGTNIVEFSKRLYGLANVSRISTQDLLALGSASDAMGLMPEVSATAFNKLFTSIQRQHNLIEQSLGMTKGTIKQYYDEGKTMDAIVEIFERMNEKGNLNLLGNIFKDLGSDGARLVNVMATMADRADILRKHLQTSRDAFKEGEAVIGEYMIQNQTAAALLERSANLWSKAFVNPEGVDLVKELAQAWYDLSKAMTQSEGLMASLHFSLQTIGLAIESLIKMFPFLLRQVVVLGFAFGFRSAVMGVMSLVKGLGSLITAIRSVNSAMGALNLLMKSNPFLLVASTIATAATLLYDYSKAAEEAAEREAARQAELKKSFDNSREAVEKVVKPLETYKKVLDEANLSEKQKMEMVKQFRRDYQEYLDYLGIEINSALDLANAYAKVVDIMKIKKAYEERENYRTQLNGETRMERIGAQSKVEGAARAFGLSDVDKAYLEKNQAKGTDALYRELIERKMGAKALSQDEDEVTFIYVDDKLVNAGTQFGPRAKKRYKKSGSKELYNAIDEYIASFRKEKSTDKEVDAMFDSEFTWTDKNGKKRKLSEFNMDEYNQKVQEARWKRGGSLDNEKPDKDAARAAKKAEAERRKALRAEMKEEQAQAKAIIDNVKNYYQRQINAITEMANTTGMDPKLQEQMVNGMKERMNEALANVRKAIGGTKNDWEAFKQTMRDDLYEPLGEDGTNLSTELLDKVMDNNLNQLRTMIEKLSKELNQQGSVLLDQILRKASENEGINAKIENALMRAREKELLERNYTGKVDKDTEGTMEQFGIAAITDAQSKQIRDWSAQGNDAAIERFLEMRTKYWQVAFGNARKNLLDLLQQDVNTKQGQESVLQLLFGEDWKEGLTGSELEGILNMTADQWQVFYQKLIEYTDKWTDAQKKAYDDVKKRQDYIFENRTDVMGLNSLELGYEQKAKANQRWGKPQTFAERMGLGSMESMTNDPEVKMMEIKLTKAELYYKRMEELRKTDQISEEQLMDAKKQWSTAQEALMDKLAEQAKQKMEQIQQLLDPIKEFGAAAGDAMYLTVNGLEGEGDAWRNAVKNIIKTYGEMTIQMIEKQLLQMIVMKQHHQEQEDEEQAHQDRMKQIQNQGDTNEINAQNVLNAKIISTKRKANKTEEKEDKKAEDEKVNIAGEGGTQLLDIATQVGTGMVTAKKQEADQTQQIEQQQQATSLSGLISDTVAKVVLGIAGGSAKTVSELGWWGLPLVAVISAALMGLLNFALSAIGGGRGGSEKAAAKPKVKLASGMLTYDKGNVQETVGSQWRGKNGEYITDERRTVVGDDGRVYRAREQRSLPEGVSMVTEPIATRVNGQQALVGERGPEIVIGRKTTRAIQMNRPDLLRDLAMIDRGITTRKVRTFDEGNISDLASAIRPADASTDAQTANRNQQIDAATAEALRQMPAAMAAFAQVMTVIQKQGIQAKIQKYGTGGLIDEVQSGLKFVNKYKQARK